MGVEKAYIMPFTSHLLDSGLELGYKIRDPNNGPYTEGDDKDGFIKYFV